MSARQPNEAATWAVCRPTFGDLGIGAIDRAYYTVADGAGLASIQTTLNIYTHVVDASHRKAIEAVERELFPSVPKSADQLANAVPVSDS